jgi:hypothetical protein
MIGNAQELADGGNVGFATRAVETFRDVEDEVGTQEGKPRRKMTVGFETIDLADSAECPLHRIDGCGLVPLGVQVWLREVGSEGPTGRLVG